MMILYVNFVMGTISAAGIVLSIDSIEAIDCSSIKSLVFYLISIAGGILSTVIIDMLRVWFPALFMNRKEIKN